MIFFHLWGISLRKFQIQKCLVHNNKWWVHWVCREKCNSNWIFFLFHNFKKSFSNSWICNNPWAKWYFSYQVISLGLGIHRLGAQTFTSLKAQFFREINFTKFSWNWFHEIFDILIERSVIKEVNDWALIGSSSWFLFKFFTPQAGRSNKITTNCLRTASNFQNPFIRMGMSDIGWIIFTYGNWTKSLSGSRSRSRFCSRTTYTGWLIWIGPNHCCFFNNTSKTRFSEYGCQTPFVH